MSSLHDFFLYLANRKQRREDRLSKAPSLADTDSQDSTTPMNISMYRQTSKPESECEIPASTRRALFKAAHLYGQGDSEDPVCKSKDEIPVYRAMPYDITDTEGSTPESPCRFIRSNSTGNPHRQITPYGYDYDPLRDKSDVTTVDYLSDICDQALDSDEALLSPSSSAPRSHAPLVKRASNSDGNLPSQSNLPNGVLILSPNGDIFARNAYGDGKNVHVIPKNTNRNQKNFCSNLPQSMKTLPLKDNRVKSNLARARGLGDQAITNNIETVPIEQLSKEDIVSLWKNSERELNQKLNKALREKEILKRQLSEMSEITDTGPETVT